PLKDWPSAEELERQRSATTDRALEERLRRKRDTRLALGDGATCSVLLWIWRVGNSLLVGVPEEAYSLVQTKLRQRYGNTAIACLNLVNDRVGGYLPPQDRYGLNIYQEWRTPFARGSLEIVIDALSNEIERITAEKAQTRECLATP
ncbi:MAG TPA: alkaline ceramidase, partial [Lacipirellulaceae bacterium]|nr:alkaline ceramidase [Lacipirellulaceae bacterium]